MLLTLLFILFSSWISYCGGLSFNLTLNLTDNNIIQNELTKVYFNYSFDGHEALEICIYSIELDVIEVVKNNCILFKNELNYESDNFFILKGLIIGHGNICFDINHSSEIVINPKCFKIGVIRTNQMIDITFTVLLSILMALNLGLLGAVIDLEVIIANVKRPIAPLIGFLCQFAFMPSISFGLALGLLTDHNFRMGFFTLGCCPGGGASNFWTLLLGGDAALSVTMTFISIMAAFGMMPLWIYTLGKFVFTDDARIPFVRLLIVAMGVSVPVIVGVIIQKCKPAVKIKLKPFVKWLTFAVVIIVCTLGIYTNIYVMPYFTFNNFLIAFTLPCAGFFFGGIAAIACQRKPEEVIAISIETGLQNGAIAYVLLKYSLPQPDADISVAMTIIILAATNIPLFFILLIKVLWNYYLKKTRTINRVDYESPKGN